MYDGIPPLNVTRMSQAFHIPLALCLRHPSHTFPTAVLAGPGSLSFSEAPTSVIQTQTSTVLVSNAESLNHQITVAYVSSNFQPSKTRCRV